MNNMVPIYQNSLATRSLARLTKGFVFVNLGTTFRKVLFVLMVVG